MGTGIPTCARTVAASGAGRSAIRRYPHTISRSSASPDSSRSPVGSAAAPASRRTAEVAPGAASAVRRLRVHEPRRHRLPMRVPGCGRTREPGPDLVAQPAVQVVEAGRDPGGTLGLGAR